MAIRRRTPAEKAAHTAKWATIMAKWAVTYAAGGGRSGARKVVRWQFVVFAGPDGKESRGIVDAIAIRKDHRPGRKGLDRGDQFEIVLLQVKGGTARRPSTTDLKRLREVQRLHGAVDVVLVEWVKNEALTFSRLKPRCSNPLTAWEEVTPASLFGSR